MHSVPLCLLIGLLAGLGCALDNGLALTPPMGWLTWQRYRCEIDCKNYPRDCINEELIMRTAHLLVEDGWLAKGYEYIIIDDCWPAMERDPKTNQLVPDPKRFPGVSTVFAYLFLKSLLLITCSWSGSPYYASFDMLKGMKWLADYVHSLGLKFGIYLDFGSKTCAGYPGSIDFLQKDAKTMAEWGVDYVKMDGCYSDTGVSWKSFFLLKRTFRCKHRVTLISATIWTSRDGQSYSAAAILPTSHGIKVLVSTGHSLKRIAICGECLMIFRWGAFEKKSIDKRWSKFTRGDQLINIDWLN